MRKTQWGKFAVFAILSVVAISALKAGYDWWNYVASVAVGWLGYDVYTREETE